MTKVSKNLKRIRTSKKLTQDAVAEKLYVTRQTVSGWETGRTEPDIETLIEISKVFGVEVEELIYGEKRVVSEEEKSTKTKKILSVLFAVIASVFTAVGIVLIFITGWEEFPEVLKITFSFLPMLISQALAVFTYLKRKESVMWRESTAVIWCIGVSVSVALVDASLSVFGFENCLLADILLLLPVIYLLDAVTPLIVYYAATIFYSQCLFDDHVEIFVVVLILALLYSAGTFFTVKNRKNTDDARYAYSFWISVLAFLTSIIIVLINLGEWDWLFISLVAVCLIMYASNKDNLWSNPLKTMGLCGALILSVIEVINSATTGTGRLEFKKPDIVCILILLAFIAVMLLGYIIFRKNFYQNKTKKLFYFFTFLCFIISSLNISITSYGSLYGFFLTDFLAIAASLTIVAEGAIEGKLVPLNLGLVSASVLMVVLIMGFVDISMFTTGIMLLMFGIVLFVVNFVVTKRLTAEKKGSDENA